MHGELDQEEPEKGNLQRDLIIELEYGKEEL